MMRVTRAIPALGLMCAAVLHPVWTAAADPVDPATWPVADGDFSSPGDPGWIFFRPQGFEGRGCGIGPDGLIGCDIVPARLPDGTPVQAGLPGPAGFYSCGDDYCPLPPPGADRIIAGPQQRAQYAESETPTFTRDVDELAPGYRVVNGDAACYVGGGSPRPVVCDSGEHGFSVQAVGVSFW